MKIEHNILVNVKSDDIKNGNFNIPNNVTHIGGSAFRDCTGLTSVTFPESLTHIGDWAFCNCTGLTSVTFERFKSKKIYKCMCVGSILTFIDSQRTFNSNIELYKGSVFQAVNNKKIILEKCYIAEQDGKFAHGNTLKNALADLRFKQASERGAKQYENIDINQPLLFEEAVAMYRIITGACSFGTNAFIKTLDNKVKDEYTINDIIETTRGQYGHETFVKFWEIQNV